MRTILPLLLGSLSMASASPAPADATYLRQIEQEWCRALQQGNENWFEEHLAEDFTSISSGDGSLHGKREEMAELKKSPITYDSLELSDLQVRIESDAGIVTGINQIKGHDKEGGTFDIKLAFTDTYIRRGGRWLVWASQHTRIKP